MSLWCSNSCLEECNKFPQSQMWAETRRKNGFLFVKSPKVWFYWCLTDIITCNLAALEKGTSFWLLRVKKVGCPDILPRTKAPWPQCYVDQVWSVSKQHKLLSWADAILANALKLGFKFLTTCSNYSIDQNWPPSLHLLWVEQQQCFSRNKKRHFPNAVDELSPRGKHRKPVFPPQWVDD